jgi:cysteine desulfurase/selenocysteine lyase
MDVEAIRSGIPLLKECMYFNTAGIAPSLSVVADALLSDIGHIARHGPPLIMDSAGNSARLAEARQRIAALLGVEVEDLCLTRGVSDGVHLVFNGFDWQEGDELILTDEEHPAVQVPADRLSAACGVTLKRLVLADDPEEMLKRFRALLTPRTRLVALSHVTTDTGTRLPAGDLTRIAHERDIPVLFDGAQALGQFPVHVSSLGVDFYSFLAYKWLFGPYSTGGLYIARPWQGRLKLVPTGRASQKIPPAGARQFEIGPLAQPLYYATAAGIDYVRGIGIPAIEAYTRPLVARLRAGLKAIPGLTVHSPEPAETSTAMVAFSVKGIDGGDLNARLRARRIIPRPAFLKFSGVRVSIALFNTAEEVDAVVDAVAEIAAAGGR